MKNRIISIAFSLAILFLFIGNSTFGQNQPEKKVTTSSNQTAQMNNQKDMKTTQKQVTQTNKTQKNSKSTGDKMTSDQITKQATVTKDKKNNESVNAQYHKKQNTSGINEQKQEKSSVKGDVNKQAK